MTSEPEVIVRKFSYTACKIFVKKPTLDDGHDSALLDSRRTLETVGVDTTEKLRLQVHGVKGVGDFIVVGLDLTCNCAAQLVSFFPSYIVV
jgi:hypothetical protein